MENEAALTYNLDKLYGYVGKEYNVVKEMVGIFIDTVPKQVELMREGLEASDFIQVSKAAHMLKPSLDIFGVDDQYYPIRDIENLVITAENQEYISRLIFDLDMRIQQLVEQLKTDFNFHG